MSRPSDSVAYIESMRDADEGPQPRGRCEDFPCCGHELGDCDGSLYGTDESIKSDPHLLCDHNTGYCEVWEREQDEDEDPDFP